VTGLTRLAIPLALPWILAAASGCGGGGGSAPVEPPPPNPLYVSAARGSDANSGGATDPLRTITKAAQIAGNDYRIIVAPGTYREGVNTDRQGTPAQRLTFFADASGVESGEPQGSVVVNAAGASLPSGFQISSSRDTTIDGFTVIGAADAGIVLKSRSDDFTIQNCVIRGNSGDGIRVQDSARVLLLNNLIHDNGGSGIAIVGQQSGSPDARLFSNTIVGNGNRGLTVGNTQRASPRAVLRNNIIQDNGGDANIKVFTSPRSDLGYDEDYNLVFPATFIPANLPRGPNDVSRNAAFVNPGAGDFRLQQSSSAIDRGAELSISADQLQNLRSRTTTGFQVDGGPLDLGFHFIFFIF
jgi:parallel beta-helix repeat protein